MHRLHLFRAARRLSIEIQTIAVPQLASPADEVPGLGLKLPIKLDGYRTLAGAAGRQVAIW
jgi:hypothetical protein